MATAPSTSLNPSPIRSKPKANGNRSNSTKVLAGNSEAIISERIRDAQSALWRAELSRAILIPVVATLVAVTLWAVMDQWIYSPGKFVRSCVLIGGVTSLIIWFAKKVWPLFSQSILPEYAAHSLEHDLPELRHALTSYVSLREDQNREGVRGVVVRSIGVRAAGQLQSHEIEVPSEATSNLYWWLGVAGSIALAAMYSLLSPKDTVTSTKRLLLPLASIEAPSRVQITDVKPGDVDVIAGRPFQVSALVDGLPKNAQAKVEYGDQFATSKPLDSNRETLRYEASLSVDASTQYRIVGGDAVAGPFEIVTRDVPIVTIDQIEITPPQYTKLPPRQSRGGAIVGEENSIVKITASLNLPITRARIELNPRKVGERIQAGGGVVDMKIVRDGLGVEASFALRLPVAGSGAVALESYRLHVWDAAENDNPEPIVYPIRIIADLAPEVSITNPRVPMTEVPVNGAQRIEVQALDPDYGLKRIDLKITRGVHNIGTETIWSSIEGARGNQNATWLLQPRALGLRVGEVIQVSAVAVDNRQGEDSSDAPNLTSSDTVEFTIVAPIENGNTKLQDDGNERDKDGQQEQGDQSAEGEQDSGKGESGQGQSGGGKSGDSQPSEQGQSGEGQSGEGQSGKGEPGEENQNGGGKGTSGNQSGEPNREASDGNQNESDPSMNPDAALSDGNQTSDSSSPSGEGSPSGSEGKPGEPSNNPMNQGEPGSAHDANQSPQGQTEGANGAEKPQHDGDAFERIRDYLNNDSKGNSADQDQSGKGESEKGNSDQGDGGEGSNPSKETMDKTESDNRDGAGDAEGTGDTDAKRGDGNKDQTATGKKPAGDNALSETSDQPSAGSNQKDTSANGSDSKQAEDNAASDNATSGESGAAEDNRESSSDDQTQGASDSASGDSKQREPADGKEPSGDQASGQEQGKPSDRSEDMPSSDETGAAQPNQSDRNGSQNPSDGQTGSSSEKNDKGSSNSDSSDSQKTNPSDSASGDSANGDSTESKKPGSKSVKDGRDGDGKPGEKSDDASSQPNSSKDQTGDQAGNPSSEQGSSDASGQPNSQSEASGTTGGGESGEGLGSEINDASRPPDPVDVEEAKKATDLVLDYLDQQRDAPDPELLKRLDWTPDELRAFADRWNRIRELEKSGTGDRSAVEDALRSLGIRENQNGPIGKSRDTDDALRGLKDAGNRPAAPPIYRDAFDAFRRNVNRNSAAPK